MPQMRWALTALGWSEPPNDNLNGKIPLEMAKASDPELYDACSELWMEADRRSQRRQEDKKIDMFRSQLEIECSILFGDEKANLILAMPYRETKNRKVSESCKDQRTLDECRELLKKLRRKMK
jgi:hypothetical protein